MGARGRITRGVFDEHVFSGHERGAPSGVVRNRAKSGEDGSSLGLPPGNVESHLSQSNHAHPELRNALASEEGPDVEEDQDLIGCTVEDQGDRLHYDVSTNRNSNIRKPNENQCPIIVIYVLVTRTSSRRFWRVKGYVLSSRASQ